MRKRIVARGNIHKRDHLRALVTDTLPGDIPIVISNDGFYRNMRAMPTSALDQKELIERILDPVAQYTIPYRYNIMRSGGKHRRLSLIHPSGQLGVAKLYAEYAELICYHCRKSTASIRSPRKVGSLFFVRGTYSNKNSVKRASVDTVDMETTVSNPASYFSYWGVDRAYKFFESTDFLRLEKRYSVMYFADISKCFSSIYTHTLGWAIADVDTAKENRQAYAFSNTFDKLMQSINYDETNGICIGAEVSRVFAELILSEIDRKIIHSLSNKNRHFSSHYEFRRYVDDFYIFSQNEEVANDVVDAIAASLAQFNLHLNESKSLSQIISRSDRAFAPSV